MALKHFFLSKALRLVGSRLSEMRGVVSGIALLCCGLVGLAGQMYPDIEGLPQYDLEVSLSMVTGGLAALGLDLRSKRKKLPKASEDMRK